MIYQGDIKWLREVAMPHFRITMLDIAYSPSKKRHPDIWVEVDGVPCITVTDEWLKQNFHTRRARLTHELLHVRGETHGRKNGLNFSTHPEKDSYSRYVYRRIR